MMVHIIFTNIYLNIFVKLYQCFANCGLTFIAFTQWVPKTFCTRTAVRVNCSPCSSCMETRLHLPHLVWIRSYCAKACHDIKLKIVYNLTMVAELGCSSPSFKPLSRQFLCQLMTVDLHGTLNWLIVHLTVILQNLWICASEYRKKWGVKLSGLNIFKLILTPRQ